MAVRVSELRGSECCPVIGQIEVALPRRDNITSPETGLTSRWCSNSRPFVEPMKEAIANDGGALLLVQLPTRLMDLPPPCELAASQYRVGLLCCCNKAASSFFKWALSNARAV
jgi:hypothetical protein